MCSFARKERAAWKKSHLKWKWRLFCGLLLAAFFGLPALWWQKHVLPKQQNCQPGSIECSQHKRIMLLASVGLTFYGIGLVRYWIDLQRQGPAFEFLLDKMRGGWAWYAPSPSTHARLFLCPTSF